MSASTIAERPDVFISYAREDQVFVRHLHEALSVRGLHAWVDWEGIPPSALWMSEVRRAIEAANVFVFLVSPHSVESGICREEVEHASSTNKRLVPLVREDVEQELVPSVVAAHNWIFFREQDDFDDAFEQLIQALQADEEWVHAHTRLLVRSRDWEEQGRARSMLLRGSELDSAEQWMSEATGKDPKPVVLQTDYVVASRRASNVRRRRAFTAVVVALALSVSLAIVSLIQRGAAIRAKAAAERTARIATSRELALEAGSSLQVDPQLSLILASDAVRQAQTSEAVGALRAAVSSSRVDAILPAQSSESSWRFASFSPDGRYVATPGPDRTVRLSDVATGAMLRNFSYERGVHETVFSSDGLLLAGAGDSFHHKGGTVVWEVSSGTQVAVLDTDDPRALAFSPDGREIVTSSGSNVAELWDARTGDHLQTLGKRVTQGSRGIGRGVTSSVFSPDGMAVLTASDDGTAKLWSVRSGSLLRTFAVQGAVSSASFSANGKLVLTTGYDDLVARLWSVKSGRMVRMFPSPQRLLIGSISPDGKLILTAGFAQDAQIWNARTGEALTVLQGHSGEIDDASFSSDGHLVLTASSDATARVWDPWTGQLLASLIGHEGPVSSASFSADGQAVLTVSTDGTARIWDTGLAALRIMHADVGSIAGTATAMAAPDGTTIASASGGGTSGTVQLWNAQTGRLERRLSPDLEDIEAIDISPDGTHLAAAGQGGGGVWTVQTGRLLMTLPPLRSGDGSVSFSPDGRQLATTTGIWDLSTGIEDKISHGPGPNSTGGSIQEVEFSPDGNLVLLRGGFSGFVWDASSGEKLYETAELQGFLTDAEFSPNGDTFVMTALDGGLVSIWDTASGGLVRNLQGATGAVRVAAFSPDGRYLVAGGDDRVARIWDVASGGVVAVLEGNAGPIVDASFSPSGRWVLTASGNSVRIWEANTGDPVAELSEREGPVTSASFVGEDVILSSAADGTVELQSCSPCQSLPQLRDLAQERIIRPLTVEERRQYLHQ